MTPRSFKELETSRVSPQNVNDGWSERVVLGLMIIIECVLLRLSFISHVERQDWFFNKSLFNKSAVFIWSEGDATSEYKMVSSTYAIIIFQDHSTYQHCIGWVKSKRSKILSWGTREKTDLKFLSPKTWYLLFS